MEPERCLISDAESFVAKLTAKSVAALYDLTFGPDEVRDWGREVQELRDLARALWAVCLARLVKKLAGACQSGNGDNFRDHLFEALAAKKMMGAGGAVRYEPQAPGENNPADFLVTAGGATALVECVRPGGDLDEKLAKTTESALRRDRRCSRAVSAVLRPRSLPITCKGLDEGKGYLKHAAARVVARALGVQPGSECEMTLLCGAVAAKVRRSADGERSGVRWDWSDGPEFRPPLPLVRREQVRRVAALARKAVAKFGGPLRRDLTRALRVLLVDGVGRLVNPTGKRVRMYLQWRHGCGDETIGEAFRRTVDAVVFGRTNSARLVEDLRLSEVVVFTGDAARSRAVRELLLALDTVPRYCNCASTAAQ